MVRMGDALEPGSSDKARLRGIGWQGIKLRVLNLMRLASVLLLRLIVLLLVLLRFTVLFESFFGLTSGTLAQSLLTGLLGSARGHIGIRMC
jgi:hypothetical protein